MDKYASPAPTKFKHHKWDNVEDQLLKMLVSQQNCQEHQIDWSTISKNMPNRSVRQCKERWEKYLSPSVNNGPWSKEDDALLLKKYEEFGSRWSTIATFFTGRSNTNVKNRWLMLDREKKRNQDTYKINKVLPSILVVGSSHYNSVIPFPDIHDPNTHNSFNVFITPIINRQKSFVTDLEI